MSERAPTPERLRELARNADREARESIGAALRQGSCPEPDISKGLRAASRFQKAAKPQVVAALVDRLEALADEVDSEPTAVREPATSVQIGRAQVSDEIRALLREPLDPQDNTEDV